MPRYIPYIVLILICLQIKPLQAQTLLPLQKGIKGTPLAMTNVEGALFTVYLKETRTLTKVFQVAKWDGVVWSFLPDIYTDTGATVSSIKYYNGAMYVAGLIKKVNLNLPQNAGNIIRFNFGAGKGWEPAGTDMQDNGTHVADLETYQGKLYAGGSFTGKIGADSILNVMVYDGIKWSYIQGGTGKAHGPRGVVTDFLLKGDTLVIGGSFRSFSGISADNFIIYEDSSITGTNNNAQGIKRLVLYDHIIYAFASDSLGPLGFYKCNLGELVPSAAGLQLVSDVSSVVAYDGELWAAGNFKINNKTVSLVKYEKFSSKWSATALPDIFQPTVLFVLRNQLYLGGGFDFYNKISLGHIARFDRSLVKVTGRVYYDRNGNCSYNAGSDTFLPGRLIQITPGDIILKTDAEGQFTAILPSGIYTIKHLAAKYWTVCGTGEMTINYGQNKDTFLLFGAKPVSTNISDVRVNIIGNTGWQARKGYTEAYTITYENVGTADIGAGNLSLGYSKDIAFSASSSTPNSNNPGELNWLYTGLKAGEKRSIDIAFAVPSSVSRDSLQFTANSYIAGSDNYNDDNFDTLRQTFSVAGINKNAKFVYPAPTGSDSVAWLQPDTKEVNYLIKFENTGTDTVRTLYVIDTIDVNLNIQYTQETGASHPYSTQVVNCDPALGKGVLIWTFSNINLPPNPSGSNDFTGNRGHIGFKVQFKSKLAEAYAFKNKASIIFDYNNPMHTNYTYCEVKALSGIDRHTLDNSLKVYPNPAASVVYIDNADALVRSVSLIDMTGRELLRQSSTEALIQLHVQNLPKGVYMLKANGVKSSRFAKLVIE